MEKNKTKQNAINFKVDCVLYYFSAQLLQSELSKKQESKIINDIFRQEFNLNVDSYEEMCSIRIFDTSLADFSTNVDLHNSVKFHLPYGKFVYSELK